ncbi:MAG: hypothetical protein JXR97_04930 [Planctomycetes bacterium]|nr:hypothetical protein [Planctomycetota bacterium]
MVKNINGKSPCISGMTLIELAVTVTIFACIMLVINTTFVSAMRNFGTSSTDEMLNEEVRRCFDDMSLELGMAGEVPNPLDAKLKYPYVWKRSGSKATAEPEGVLAPYRDLWSAGSPCYVSDEPELLCHDYYVVGDKADQPSDVLIFVLPVIDRNLPASEKVYEDMTNPSDETQLPMRWRTNPILGTPEPVINWGGRVNVQQLGDKVQGWDSSLGNFRWEMVYVLVDDPNNDGSLLQRRIWDNGTNAWALDPVSGEEVPPKTLARYVERFEATMQGTRAVKVTLYLRKRDSNGFWLGKDESITILTRSISVEDQ